MNSLSHAWIVTVCLAIAIGGCSTVSTGTSQAIYVGSTPDGADCVFTREGETLGKVTTPGPITVKRSEKAIAVLCIKEGYEEARATLNSVTREGVVGGSGLIGMAINAGGLIDSASGANSRYQTAVMLKLQPLSAADRAASKPAPALNRAP